MQFRLRRKHKLWFVQRFDFFQVWYDKEFILFSNSYKIPRDLHIYDSAFKKIILQEQKL